MLEALKQRGLLKKLHYLSTVSGGGYIGAWLSASCRRHPDWLEPDAKWDDSVDHLRRYSNYLSPKVGFFSADTWSMFTVWIRNTMLVQITVILVIACVLMLPRPLLEVFRHWPNVGNLRWLSILLFLLAVAGMAGNQIVVNSPHGGAAPPGEELETRSCRRRDLRRDRVGVQAGSGTSIPFTAANNITALRRRLRLCWCWPPLRCSRRP